MFIKKLLWKVRDSIDWPIICVQNPVADTADEITGYSVTVFYVKQGKRVYRFSRDNESYWIHGGPEVAAGNFYKEMCARQRKQRSQGR